MAGKVIKRELPKGHGFAVPIDLPSSYDIAETICGHKLDKRKNYAIIDEEVCELCEWTQPCSGCSCDGDYPCSCCNERGAGCEECGYTGKRKMRVWLPLRFKEICNEKEALKDGE